MADEVEKLNYIYEWFVSEEGFGIIDDVYLPNQTDAFARINSFNFKKDKKEQIRLEARRRIEEILSVDQQLGVVAEALRIVRLQQEGGTPTGDELSKITTFLDSEDADIAPIRARKKVLIAQVNAQTDWKVVADFDVVANW